MATYLSLEEAAKKLGIATEKLVDLRSQGQVRGFRDGASWKFPDTEIDRLKDELADLLESNAGGSDSGGSGILVDDESSLSLGSSIIGGDEGPPADEGSGSDLGIGGESLGKQAGDSGGSDVNLVAALGDGSDVAIVASDMDLLAESGGSDLLEIDSADLNLDDPAILHDSAQLDLAIEPNAGSTGPVTDAELKEIVESHPDILTPESAKPQDSASISSSDLSFADGELDDDSGEVLLGGDDDSAMDVIGSDIGKVVSGSGSGTGSASSLELMDDLDLQSDSQSAGFDAMTAGSRGVDVLSELDLLSAEQGGSGLISGDSQDLLASSGIVGGSGLGSSIAADALADSDLAGIDDALADDDDLVIADDDDDLVISSVGSDISVSGDSGINLISPSDSGLSLESEPLDLAGSSISALDLGAELSDISGSGSGGGGGEGSGSLVDFQADEEFQLSPSGVGIDADIDSGSQVIEIEDSGDAIGENVDFGEAEVVAEADPFGGDVFGDADVVDEGVGFDAGGGFGDAPVAEAAIAAEGVEFENDAEAVAIDDSGEIGVAAVPAPAAMGAYEVPFSLLQCVALMLILCVLGVGGMLMTDLVRNMWTYNEISSPVSTLTDSLIGLIE